jgi:hypothetical protein
MTKKIINRIVIILSIFFQVSITTNAQTDCPPVIKLKSMYTSNNNFRQLIDSMFLNVQTLPDGSQNFGRIKI